MHRGGNNVPSGRGRGRHYQQEDRILRKEDDEFVKKLKTLSKEN